MIWVCLKYSLSNFVVFKDVKISGTEQSSSKESFWISLTMRHGPCPSLMKNRFNRRSRTHLTMNSIYKPRKVLLSVLLVFVIIFYKRLEVSIFEEKSVLTLKILKWRNDIKFFISWWGHINDIASSQML